MSDLVSGVLTRISELEQRAEAAWPCDTFMDLAVGLGVVEEDRK